MAAYGSSISSWQTGREQQTATVIYFTLGLAALGRCHSQPDCLSVRRCPDLSNALKSLLQSVVIEHIGHNVPSEGFVLGICASK